MQTDLSRGLNLAILAVTSEADEVIIGFGGQPGGMYLPADTAGGDPRTWLLELEITPGVSLPGSYLLELHPRRRGSTGSLWPYLHVVD
jgi:hypothetical protein